MTHLARWIGTGAVAGTVSVLVFQHAALALLRALGAALPTLIALVLVAPFRGQPTVTGVVPFAVLAAALVNGAWGLGTGLGLVFFGRPRANSTSTTMSSP